MCRAAASMCAGVGSNTKPSRAATGFGRYISVWDWMLATQRRTLLVVDRRAHDLGDDRAEVFDPGPEAVLDYRVERRCGFVHLALHQALDRVAPGREQRLQVHLDGDSQPLLGRPALAGTAGLLRRFPHQRRSPPAAVRR